MCPSSTSFIRPFTAPRIAAICCSTAAHSLPSSSACSSARVCPAMRRTRARSFFFPWMVWATALSSR